ncbi:hemagglutinin repeat-containing protein [Endomicrobium proavitum]|uniref:Filamentous haemagglutinin FhaB/tRNA nuclease CdiA-like TPS domain-containing protein n=1 Tax=Endomicrobium proavitum TaxID=1408281 RepID=A0A0G3WL20_9BACT|nr:hemagglutinin repeat-containing protein [Endomicrobium proavitum]AKL98199.1 exported protein of unknown function [Endomicrobium proavitum]
MKKLVSLLITTAIVAGQVNYAFSANNIEVSAGAGANVRYEEVGAKRTPVVNVAAPNEKGISHNKYDKFNVDENNLILNNSKNSIKPELFKGQGGAGEDVEIEGNVNLTQQEAEVIINEVISGNAGSTIFGAIEIAGKKADIIIANPWGIAVNGSNFINTGQIKLITGSSEENSDGLFFNLGKAGRIEIGEEGLEHEDAVKLVSRYTKISGALKAKEIEIKAGYGKYDNESEEITREEAGDRAENKYAVEASGFGSMYGNKIKIVATEEGFGVKTSEKSNLISDAGDIEIKADGKVEIKGKVNSEEKIKIEAKEIKNEGGEIYAKEQVEISADKAENVLSAGYIGSEGEVKIGVKELNNVSGVIEGSEVNIKADKINNGIYGVEGLINKINDEGWKSGEIKGGNINIEGLTQEKAKEVNNIGSEIKAENKLTIKAEEIKNEAIKTAGLDKIEGIGTMYVNKTLEQWKRHVIQYEYWQEYAGKSAGKDKGSYIGANEVEIEAGNIVNESATIEGKNKLSITGNNLINGARKFEYLLKSRWSSYNQWAANGFFGDEYMKDGTVTGDIWSKYIYTSDVLGKIVGGEIEINLQGDLEQELFSGAIVRTAGEDGKLIMSGIEAENNLTITANNINNSARLSAGGKTAIEAINNITNNDGEISGLKEVEIKAGNNFEGAATKQETGGRYNGRKLAFFGIPSYIIEYGKTHINEGGQIYSGGNLSIYSGGKINAKYLSIYGAGEVRLESEGDIKLEGIEKRDKYYIKYHYEFGEDVTRPLLGVLRSGGDMYIQGEKANMELKGYMIGVGGNLYWHLPNGSLDILSMMGRSEYEVIEKQNKGWGRREEHREHEYKEWNVGSVVSVAGNVEILTGNNINILSSTLESLNGIMELTAGMDVNILAGANYESAERIKIENGTFGLSYEKEETRNEKTTAAASQISGAKGIKIKAGNEVNIIGSDIEGGGDSRIEAKTNINILSFEESEKSYYHHEKESFNALGALAGTMFGGLVGGIVAGNAFKNKDSEEKNVETTKERGSSINIAGALLIKSETKDITITGSEIAAKEIDVVAQQGAINILTALETQSAYNKKESGNKLTGTETDIKAKETGSNKSTSILSGKNIRLISAKAITSISGKYEAGEDVDLISGYVINSQGELERAKDEKGNNVEGKINLLAAQDYENSYSYHKKSGGLLDMINPANIKIDISGRGIEASTSYEESVDESTSKIGVAQVNEISAAGKVNIESTKDVISAGSQIEANGDINVTADGKIILASAQNSQSSESRHDETTVTVGVKIGNAYVDAGYAAAAVVEAEQAVEKAASELKRIQELQEQGKASQEAVDDATANVAMASLNLANATVGLAASIAGAASAASSSFGTGMYASAFANYDTMSQQSKSESILSVQGNIASNGNINFKSANDMIQEGTNAYATNGTLSYNVGNNLIIQASKDTYAQEDKSAHASAGVSVGNNSVQVSAGGGESSSKIKATTYNNSESVANNIEINVGNNATLSGANVTAKNNLDVTVGNNLTVESLQDTYYSKGNSWDANVSVGIGTKSMGSLLGGEKSNAGNNSVGAGFNTGNDYTDSAWVTEQTSLTGGSNVTINVGNKTTVTGAVINSESNNLTLTTKELEHNDIEDRNITESKGFGLSTSIGTSQSDKGKTNVAPNGSTTLTLKNTGEEKEQTTKATIGNGTIIINGEVIASESEAIHGLNRDITNTQETTKDIITGALDASATIDNRALLGFIKTEVKDKDGKVIGYTTGYQSIANDFKYLPGNAVKATAGALSTAASPLTAIYASITASKNSSENGENSAYDKTDIISVWKANQSANATGILRGGSEEAGTIVEKIKAGKATPEEIQALAKMTADGKSNLMYSEKGELIDSAGKVVLGFNDIKEHQGYVNLGNGAATNALTFALTDAEERAHNYTGNESIAKGAAKSELTYYNAVSWLTGGKTITENNSNTGGYGTLTQLSWNNTYNTSNNTLLKENTQKANQVKLEDKSYSTQTKWVGIGRYKVLGAKKDGDVNVYNEYNKIIGQTPFDDEFVKHDSTNRDLGAAIGATIFLDNILAIGDYNISLGNDKTALLDGKVEQALGESLWVIAGKSRSGREYDVKKSLGDYNGYLYNGKIVSGRGLGNILFGRNIENINLPNIGSQLLAGGYHQGSNHSDINIKEYLSLNNILDSMGETDEAAKHIKLGILEQQQKNNLEAEKKLQEQTKQKLQQQVALNAQNQKMINGILEKNNSLRLELYNINNMLFIK